METESIQRARAINACRPINVVTRMMLSVSKEYVSTVPGFEEGGSKGPCWVWVGSLYPNGYGKTNYGSKKGAKFGLPQRKSQYAHRLMYMCRNELNELEPIEEEQLDHLCRVRACCNPEHLEPVTRVENVRRSPFSKKGGRPSKTHCKNGHEFTPENTYLRPAGGRSCRECMVGIKSRRRSKCAESARVRNLQMLEKPRVVGHESLALTFKKAIVTEVGMTKDSMLHVSVEGKRIVIDVLDSITDIEAAAASIPSRMK